MAHSLLPAVSPLPATCLGQKPTRSQRIFSAVLSRLRSYEVGGPFIDGRIVPPPDYRCPTTSEWSLASCYRIDLREGKVMNSKLESPTLSRRDWLRSAMLVGVASQAAQAAQGKLLPTGVVLFQGDSVTDVGRNRERSKANDSSAMGHGYPLLIASHLLGSRAQDGLRVYNRGVSGNRVPRSRRALANRYSQHQA